MGFWNNKKGSEETADPKTSSQPAQSPRKDASGSNQAAPNNGRANDSRREPARAASHPSPTVVEGEKAAKPAPEKQQAAAHEPAREEPSSHEKWDKFRSALGVGTVIQGKLSFDTPVRIDGKLSGEIYSSKALVVGEHGSIDAEVDVASLVVMGAVKGNLKASERIELLRGGKIEGDITTPALVVEDGAVFNGKCTMVTASKIVGVGDKGRNDKKPGAQPATPQRPAGNETRVGAATEPAKEEAPATEQSTPSLH